MAQILGSASKENKAQTEHTVLTSAYKILVEYGRFKMQRLQGMQELYMYSTAENMALYKSTDYNITLVVPSHVYTYVCMCE